MRTRRRPELLAPAGDMEKLQMAVAYGADAVYLAGTSFGMRSFAGNFTPEELPQRRGAGARARRPRPRDGQHDAAQRGGRAAARPIWNS